MNKKIKLISFFALSFFLFSCENNEEIKKTASKRVKVVNNVILKEQKDLTTISNFFGGVQSSQIDSLIPNNLKDQWTKYTNKMDATYKNVNSKKEIMSVWENKNISIKYNK